MIHGQFKNGKEEKCHPGVIQQVYQVEKLRQQVGVVSNPVSPARQHGCKQFKPHCTALVPMLGISVTVSRQCKADGVSSVPLCLKDTAQEALYSLCLPCLPHAAPQ